MKHRRLHVVFVTGLVGTLAVVMWVLFAPIALGGSDAYIITHGISMEPLFHTGDLAIVRAQSTYKVGQIVAYHSTLLNETVLHRIYAIHHGRYIFKGDNNHFFDPVHPTRNELIGRLWIHLPHVGLLLERFRTPVGAGLLAAAIGLVLIGFEKDYVKGRRTRQHGTNVPGETRPVKPVDSDGSRAAGLRDGLLVAGLALAVFAGLCLFAFHRPYRVASTRPVPYTQQAVFTYSAHVAPDAVYPTGSIVTGDPIFLNFVDDLTVGLHYSVQTSGRAHLTGTGTVALRLTGPTGWTRTIPLVGKLSFVNGQFKSSSVISLTSVKTLISQVQTLTGVEGSAVTLAVMATVHLSGSVSGAPVHTTYSPAMSFQMGATQLQPESASGNLTNLPTAFTDTRHGSVTVASSRANPVRVLGHSIGVSLLRVLTGAGLLLSALAALTLGIMMLRLGRLTEPEQIEAQYRHLIVPLADDAAFSEEPVDLVTIEALVKLADHSGRLILHSQHDGADSYLLNDGDALYRYRVGAPATNGDASGPRPSAPREPAVSASGPPPPPPPPRGTPSTSTATMAAPPEPAVPSVSEAAAVFAAAAFAAAAEPPAPAGTAAADPTGAPHAPLPDFELETPSTRPHERPDEAPPPAPVTAAATRARAGAGPARPAATQSSLSSQDPLSDPSVTPHASEPPAPTQTAAQPPEIRIRASKQPQRPAEPEITVRRRPPTLASTPTPPQVPHRPQLLRDPEPPPPTPSADPPSRPPSAAREPRGADAGSRGAHAARALFDATRRWRRRLT